MLSNHSRNFGRLGEVALPALRVGGAARSWLPPSQKKALHTLFGQGIGRFAIEGKTSALPAIFGGRGSVPVVNVKGHGVGTCMCHHTLRRSLFHAGARGRHFGAPPPLRVSLLDELLELDMANKQLLLLFIDF